MKNNIFDFLLIIITILASLGTLLDVISTHSEIKKYGIHLEQNHLARKALGKYGPLFLWAYWVFEGLILFLFCLAIMKVDIIFITVSYLCVLAFYTLLRFATAMHNFTGKNNFLIPIVRYIVNLINKM
ncbi:MAG: hypothetical protein LDL24_11870 [Treponema sp.]|nr:hypothetical protein [Treponema sp.]